MRKPFAHFFLCLLLAILLSFTHCTLADTFTVTTTNDTGSGSLRDAVTAANPNGASADTINFSLASGPQAITLSSILPALGTNLTITGTGANVLNIDGNTATQILVVPNGFVVNISGLRFANGRAKGTTAPMPPTAYPHAECKRLRFHPGQQIGNCR